MGETEVETRVVDSLGYSKKHVDFNSITTEVEQIQNTLYKIGYIENKVSGIEKINDSTFHAQIALKTKFSTIYIYYKNEDVEKAVLKAISSHVFDEYFILEFPLVENALNFINSETSKKGFPFSRLQLSNITAKNKTRLEAELTIESSTQKRSINNIVLKGYEKFPKSYLKYYLKVKPGQTFNLAGIKKKTEQLANLNFANETKPPEVLFLKDSTNLYLYLEKSRSNTFDGFLGFGTNEDTNRLEFDGYLNLNLINNLNFGESFRLLYKSDENDQKTFEADASLPYLFNSPVGIDLLLRIFKRDSSFTTVNQSAKIHYQINAQHKIFAGIVATESNNLLSTNITLSIEDYKTQFFTTGYQFQKAQPYNLLFRVKSRIDLETGFGNRKTEINKEKQSLFSIDAFNIFNLNQKNSIFIRANGANLVSGNYFENELLRFGGINSIRGFEENSLFASLFGIINTEYRFQLNNAIYIHSIFDTGYFENKIAGTQQKLFGYGFGFGILTKAGLFKLNYANGKNEDSEFKLSNSKVHISLKASF
ncbi:POTRA domain-containing protein [Tamlana flava]|uniref:POTRA domain-containing protein n=1 Tax=Tamlana flava TaxID=3158572 RepID=UPI00351B41FE